MNNISKAIEVVKLVIGYDAAHALPVEKVATYSTLLTNAGDNADEQLYASFLIRKDLLGNPSATGDLSEF